MSQLVVFAYRLFLFLGLLFVYLLLDLTGWTTTRSIKPTIVDIYGCYIDQLVYLVSKSHFTRQYEKGFQCQRS